MKQCTDGEPKCTLTYNPTTKELLLLCKDHALRHRNGEGFPVYAGPSEEKTW